jgi:hypothetical protein
VVTFSSPLAAARASAPALRYFGFVVWEKACAVVPAGSVTALYLRGLPAGIRHSALALLLAAALEPAGFSILPPAPPAAAPAPPAADGGDGEAPPAPAPSAFEPAVVTNAAGEATLSFRSFADAMAALEALGGLRVGRRVGARRVVSAAAAAGAGAADAAGAAGAGADAKLAAAAAAEAEAFEWRRAGEVTVGFARADDLRASRTLFASVLGGGTEGAGEEP